MKTTYNYFNEIQKDLINYLDQNNISAGTAEELHDELFYSIVTGNAAGGYIDNETAAANLQGNEILLNNALKEWGYTKDDASSIDAITLDVFLRCSLLESVIKNTVTFLAAA